MKFIPLLTILIPIVSYTQSYDYSPKLNPVWSRLGDIYGENGDVESVEFSPDGRYIVSGTKYDHEVVLWRTSDGVEQWRYNTGWEIEVAMFSPDGKTIAVASEDYKIRLLNVETGEVKKVLDMTQGIDGLTFSHNGKWLIAGEEAPSKPGNGKVKFFSMPEAQLEKTVTFSATVNSLDVTADSKYLLALGGQEVKVYNLESLEEIATVTSDVDVVHLITARFSPDGNYIAAGDNGGYVHVWDWREEKLKRRFNSTGMKLEIVDWAPTGKYLVTGGFDNYLRIYRTDYILDRKNHKVISPHGMHDVGSFIEYLSFSPNGELICTANQDGTVRLWVFMKNDASEANKRHRALRKKQSSEAGKG